MRKKRFLCVVRCIAASILSVCFLLTGCAGSFPALESDISLSLMESELSSSYRTGSWSNMRRASLRGEREDLKDHVSEDLTRIHVIDVGQGNAILIQAGELYALMDGGDVETADILVDYLREQGVSSLEYVIATHPHADHIGGLDEVIREFDVKKVLMPRLQHNTRAFEDLLLAIRDKNLRITEPSAGEVYLLGRVSMTIVAPDPDKDFGEDLNNGSVAMVLRDGDCSFFLGGDSEISAEKYILQSGRDIDVDGFLVNHHGSSSSSTAAFLKALSPDFAVISVGAENSYGHPAEKVLERLEKEGCMVHRTDLCGTVVVNSNSKVWEIVCVDGHGELNGTVLPIKG